MTTNTSVDTSVASLAAKASGGGTATSIFGWITSNEMMALLGVVIAFLGFSVNVFFKIREDRRQQELHRLAMSRNEQSPQ